MSRRRHYLKPASDSLDLLLDAMCNMFGGIVLISVMMAVLTREQAVSEHATSIVSEARELLQRRIQRAEKDLVAAQQLRDSMEKREADPSVLAAAELTRQREDIAARLENAREALAKTDRTRTAARATQYSDPGERQRALLVEMSQLKKTRINLQNRIAGLVEEIPRLTQRLKDLGERYTQARAEATRKLRLPKERATTKTPFYIILRHGEVYPRYIFSGGDMEVNRKSINWRTTSDNIQAIPVKGAGIKILDSKNEKRQEGLNELETWIKPVSKDTVYITFLVYHDSFAEFNAVKERITSLGIDFGWAAFEEDDNIIFTKNGKSAPPPL